MDGFFNLTHFFNGAPTRALALALIFIAFALVDRWLAGVIAGVKPWVQLVPATGWTLFAINEEHMRIAEVAHRFDHAITLPVLALLTLIALIGWIGNIRRAVRAWRAPRGRADDGDN